MSVPKEYSFLIRIFAAMKKLTIWIVSVIIGVSFLGLLMLQMRYIEQMVKMRKEQFDESVIRSLNQASRNLEQNETFRYLERFTRENPGGLSDSVPRLYIDGAHNFDTESLLPDTVGRIHSGFELKTIVKHPSTMPKVLRVEGGNRIDEASRTFREHIKIERGLELALECVRWPDLKRWGIDDNETLNEIAGRDDDFNNFVIGKHIRMPIPQSDCDNNPNLKQNPNY